MNRRHILSLVIFPLLFSGSLYAADNQKELTLSNNSGLSVSGEIGHLSGKAKEFVYDDESGSKMSELDWKTKNAAIFKAGLTFEPPEMSWLTFNVNGWFTLAEGKGSMSDYDWTDPAQSHWTDKSYHPDTKLFYANEVDVNATAWLLKNTRYQLGLQAGFKKTIFDWSAKGGEFNYDNGETSGAFPNENVISYKQTFNTPYIGLSAKYQLNDALEFSGKITFSDWVRIRDFDDHIYSGQYFKGRINNARHYAVEADMMYHLTQNTDLTLGVEYNDYRTHSRGDTSLYDSETNTIERSPSGVSGVSNHYLIGFLGLKYTF